MAVTANQMVNRADGCKKGYPVAASTHLYQATMAFVNASGYLDDDTASGVNAFAGITIEEKDNSGGSAGDVSTEIWRKGDFLLTGSGFTQASVGLPVYATDNYTLTTTQTTSGAVKVGIVAEYVSTTKVWVSIDASAAEGLVGDSLATKTIDFNGATGINEIHVPTNLADALSLEVTGVGDVFALDTSTGAIVFAFGAAVRVNILGDAQIGNATTDLVAFHGSTPTDQCAAYTQTFATADRTHAARTATARTVGTLSGTANGAMEAVGDTMAGNVGPAISNNFQELFETVNAIIVDLADTAALVNAVVDDLQEKGLAG